MLVSINKVEFFSHEQTDEVISAAPQQRPPPYYLSSQQLQMLQFLQQNHGNLTQQQQALLVQLQQQYRAMQQHQQHIRLQQQQAAQRGLRPGQPGHPTTYGGHPQNLGQTSSVIKNYGIPQQPVNIEYIIFRRLESLIYLSRA